MRWLLITMPLGLLVACSGGEGDGPDNPRAAHLRDNRLYSGAPPVIPHAVASLGRGKCLDCHRHGDVNDNGRIATVTPHPELERCQQCHVEQVVNEVFKPNTFPGSAYKRGLRQNPYSPLLIPHPLTLRENCLGCHGPKAVAWLRTSHPERTRCNQCHVPASDGWPAPRAYETRRELAERREGRTP
jgi:cytochrome c-type protein NapB